MRPLFPIYLLPLLICLGTVSGQNANTASSRQHGQSHSAAFSVGAVSNGVYRNSFFGMSYKLPYGWVDRTDEMRQDDSDKRADAHKGEVLLAVFERPPQARGQTVNSSVVIATETTDAYPGIKSAAQYFGPLNEVITKQGLKALNEPYEFPVDARPLVRCDYMGAVSTVTVHQSTLAMIDKGHVLSVTFIGGSDDEITELLESLSFGKVKAAGGPRP